MPPADTLETGFAIWWHDAAGSTHIHPVLFATAEAATEEAARLGVPAPIVAEF